MLLVKKTEAPVNKKIKKFKLLLSLKYPGMPLGMDQFFESIRFMFVCLQSAKV